MKVKTIVTWILSVFLALGFLGVGFAKVMSAPMMVAEFTLFGYPAWFMYLTGTLEIVSAVLVLVPRFALIGVGLISCIMLGALASHLAHGQVTMIGAPLVFLILAIVVGILRGPAGVVRRPVRP